MAEGFLGIIDNLVRWGDAANQVHAALIVGSQAREDHYADQYSDLDLILIVDDPDYFILTDQWLKEIGTFHISFSENTFAGGKERRILFDGALDVDFIFLRQDTPERIVGALEDDSIAILRRGYRILIDKIALCNVIPDLNPRRNSNPELTEQDYINMVHDFWYHSVWAAKKLKRGEIWVAKFCVDTYLKQKLLSMIEWYAHAIHGRGYDTWHSGRFIEEWADPWVVERLQFCFSDYNESNIKTALLSTMDLFRSVAVETAQKLGFPYPVGADKYAITWVVSAL